MLLAGKHADAAAIAELQKQLGLDQSWVMQYAHYLQRMFFFDWGVSWTTHQPIREMLSSGWIPTLSLSLPAFVMSILVALGLSVAGSVTAHSWMDRLITGASLLVLSFSFLIIIVFAQKFLAFNAGLFPVYGWADGSESIRYLLLPWLIYVVAHGAPLTLIFRAALLQERSQPYVRTALAQGLSAWQVHIHHILKNALFPLVTVVTTQLPYVLTGSLLLETYFGIPGIGGMLVKALQNNDLPVVQAMTFLGALIYISANFLNDVVLLWLDPRRRERA